MKIKQILKYGLIPVFHRSIQLLNNFIPKKNQVIIIGNHSIEDNALALADYIASRYDYPVYYQVAKKHFKIVRKLITPKVKLLDEGSKFKCLITAMRSRYIFYTYPYAWAEVLKSNDQRIVNIWHGVPYKKLALDVGRPGVPADFTIATSRLTQDIFSHAFGVSKNSIIITGYPRNDMMLNAQKQKDKFKSKLGQEFEAYKKILIWMPTYRRIFSSEGSQLPTNQSIDISNALQTDDFDIEEFDKLLRENQSFCIIKPHQLYKIKEHKTPLTNIKIIDNAWIHSKDMSLYQFLACTDALITDYSSVMSDYSLLDQPIFCFSTDLEEYKKTHGLYFDDFNQQFPAKHINNTKDLLQAIHEFILNDIDHNKEQRRLIRNLHFQYNDNQSSKRITQQIFNVL